MTMFSQLLDDMAKQRRAMETATIEDTVALSSGSYEVAKALAVGIDHATKMIEAAKKNGRDLDQVAQLISALSQVHEAADRMRENFEKRAAALTERRFVSGER